MRIADWNKEQLAARFPLEPVGELLYYPGPFFRPARWPRVFVQRFLVLIALPCLALAGCGLYHPPLFQPGTIQQQRLRATIHDPYPDPDLGPNDGGSARPRDYQEPLPEPVRNRLYVDSWWWRQQQQQR